MVTSDWPDIIWAAAVFTASNPEARVQFEVERGLEFVGTVTRDDGSPLKNGLVVVEQAKAGSVVRIRPDEHQPSEGGIR